MTAPHPYVIFDVGNTLIGFTKVAPFRRFLQDWQPERRVSAAEGKALLDRWNDVLIRRRHEARGKGATAAELVQFWRSLLTEICAVLPEPEAAAAELWQRFNRGDLQQLYSDVRPTLHLLRRRSVPMGIISNFQPELEDYLKRLRIRTYFQFVICSSVVGLRKPDRAIFDMGVRLAGRPSGEILYVGDDPYDDVEGARTAGLTPVLIDRDYRYPQVPCLRIRTLTELGGLL